MDIPYPWNIIILVLVFIIFILLFILIMRDIMKDDKERALEILKEMYHYCDLWIAYGMHNTPKQTAQGIKKVIKNKFDKAGIEVEDVCK